MARTWFKALQGGTFRCMVRVPSGIRRCGRKATHQMFRKTDAYPPQVSYVCQEHHDAHQNETQGGQ